MNNVDKIADIVNTRERARFFVSTINFEVRLGDA